MLIQGIECTMFLYPGPFQHQGQWSLVTNMLRREFAQADEAIDYIKCLRYIHLGFFRINFDNHQTIIQELKQLLQQVGDDLKVPEHQLYLHWTELLEDAKTCRWVLKPNSRLANIFPYIPETLKLNLQLQVK